MNASRALPAVSLATALAALVACQSGPDMIACPAPTVELTQVAAVAYIDSLEPTPRKFLFATQSSWGDSALPEPAAVGLRGKGPSYLYPPDSSLNRQVRDRLVGSGPFSGFLPFYHGMQAHGDTAVDFTFSGRFVTGSYDGLVVPHKAVRLVCDGTTGNWITPKPAADSTSDSAAADTTAR